MGSTTVVDLMHNTAAHLISLDAGNGIYVVGLFANSAQSMLSALQGYLASIGRNRNWDPYDLPGRDYGGAGGRITLPVQFGLPDYQVLDVYIPG